MPWTPDEQARLETAGRQLSPSESPAVTDHDGKTEDDPHTVGPAFSPAHEILLIFMICMAQFLSLAGLAQTIAPLGIIGRSFGVVDEGELSWYPAAFSLTLGTFILPAGRLVITIHTTMLRRDHADLFCSSRATCTATGIYT